MKTNQNPERIKERNQSPKWLKTDIIIIMNQWPHIDGIEAGPLHLQHSDSVWPGKMMSLQQILYKLGEESCATCRRKQEKQGPSPKS